jgi:site-specific DNA-methyltransferase (cytosine-N4-specific)
MKVPFTQQFTPKVTPLNRLLPILRSNAGNPTNLKKAIASAFFKDSADPMKMAGNTQIALRYCGILGEGDKLTDFGQQLLDQQGDLDEVHRLLARHFLVNLDGIGIVETLREMASGGVAIQLTTLPDELAQRGFENVKNNSSDLSGVFNWLRQAKALNGYNINPAVYYPLIGTSAITLNALKDLDSEQVAFLRAMALLNVTDWTAYNGIVRHAEDLYSGEIRFNPKMIVNEVLKPLEAAGFIEIRKKEKQDKTTREGRGGKPADVKPTPKFETEVAEPLLSVMYRAAGFNDIRTIRGTSLEQIVKDIKQTADTNKQGTALELLAMRLCQMIDLQFMGWRETDIKLAGGGEIDGMFYSSRLVYSRWQIQCKIGPITVQAVAKEVGMQHVTLGNVILIVSTSNATGGAQTYRKQIVSTSNLNIIFIEGNALERIIKDNSLLVEILREQAQYAMSVKPDVADLKPPSNGGNGNSNDNDSAPVSSSGDGGTREAVPAKTGRLFSPAYSTPLGRMYCGDSLEVLPSLIQQGVRAKLIMTSPPFALVRKKTYGNEEADSYVRWFDQFVPYLKDILEPNGSLVIDIGGAWLKGLPAKSIYQYKLLVRLCESGYYLAQEFYHYNPAKLPTPAEWVTVRRMRVKDAVNNVFWLTLDPFADADNRRVLAPYSESMKTLLRNGYKAALRPSGHDISKEFSRDNGGAIPPNLLQFSNTESNSYYLRRCKEEGIKPHPARFPQVLPEFFIKFLTRPGEVVLDFLAGSNVTGAAAEKLGRQWVAIEQNDTYVEASKFRFESQPQPTQKKRAAAASASQSCAPSLFSS